MLAAVRAGAPGGFPVRVAWDAPAGCSDVDTFFAGVAARAERVRRAEPGEEGARLEVKLARQGPKVHGELRLVAGDGASELRKVDGATCDEVAEALSLTAALALTTSARVVPPASGGGPAPSPAVAPAAASAGPAVPPAATPPAATPMPALPPLSPVPPPAAPPVRADAPGAAASGDSSRNSSRDSSAPSPAAPGRSLASWLAVGLGPAVGEVVAPHLSVGGTAQLHVAERRPDHLGPSASLGFLYLRNDLLGAADAAFRLAAASVTACPGWGWHGGLASVEACATGVGGWLAASDAGVTVSRSVSRSWWSAGAMLRARAPIGAGFSLQLDASATVPLVKRRFVTTTPEQTVGTSPAVAPLVGLTVVHGL